MNDASKIFVAGDAVISYVEGHTAYDLLPDYVDSALPFNAKVLGSVS